MIWKKYRLTTTTEAEEVVAATLMECGIEGVEIVDKIPLTEEEKKQMFVDIAPEAEQDDGSAFLFFYLDPAEDTEAVLARVREELETLRDFCDIGSGAIDISETEDVDWINNWKQYFHQFAVNDVRIVPSWEEVPADAPEELVLRIDPGTGMHETTQLCMRQIGKYLREGNRVLDVGCGSGILAIVALKKGAAYALGTDLDPCAENAVEDNCAQNQLSFALCRTGAQEASAQLELLLGNLIDDPVVQKKVGSEEYDVAFSNILTDVLVPLAAPVATTLKQGGIWITSGILQGQEQKVKDAAEQAGFVLVEENTQGEWVGLTFRKE